MSKEDFKAFVRGKPELASLVANKQASWQKLYETYDLYGEDEAAWNNFLTPKTTMTSSTTPISTFSDITNTLKNIDLDTVQKGINGIQKAIGLLQDIGASKNTDVPKNYEERPIYKYYED